MCVKKEYYVLSIESNYNILVMLLMSRVFSFVLSLSSNLRVAFAVAYLYVFDRPAGRWRERERSARNNEKTTLTTLEQQEHN